MSNTVAVAGSGPAAAALVAALEDATVAVAGSGEPAPVAVTRVDPSAVGSADVGVVVDRVGSDAFEAASDAALEASTPWFALELGGVGGYPVADASIAGFDPARECFACLEARVTSNVERDADPVGVPNATTQHVAGAIAADAAVDVLAGDAEAVLGRLVELPYQDRRFLPVPGCDCADARDVTVRRGVDAVDVETALRRGERALDDRVGIVRDVGEAESYPAPYYLAHLCDTSEFSDATAPDQAAGVAEDWNGAFAKGLGESFERYAAGVYHDGDATRAAARELDSVVRPTAFVTPGDPDWDADDQIEWIEATNLATDSETTVPASLVFHPPRTERFRPAVTTGLGLWTSPTGAILSGLYEVIERDAAMLSWYSSYEPLGLAVEDGPFERLAARARSEDLSVTPVLLTQDVDVPVVAVAVHRDRWPAFAVGSAADLDPAAAARSALEEALQNWMELRGMGPEGASEAGGAIGAYAAGEVDATGLIDVTETVPADSVGPEDPPTGEAELDAVVERVSQAGMTPYATRTTTRDLEIAGFEAVRVLVPSAQPIFFDDPYFGERADSVPADLGFEPRLDRPHHPFP